MERLYTDSKNSYSVLNGETYNKNKPKPVEGPIISIPGVAFDGEMKSLDFNDDMLGTHVAMIGGTGTGKSNVFNHIIDKIKLKNNDILIIFDTKGNYLEDFSTGNDAVVFSYDSNQYSNNTSNYWNIFKEIDPNDVESSIREISISLFKDAKKHSTSAYFPNAAADLLYAVIYIYYDLCDEPTNYGLINWLNNASPNELYDIIMKYDSLKAIANNISSSEGEQTQGVISEFYTVVRRIFVGDFAKNGTLSMSELVKNRIYKKIFIEYDMKLGETLSPIYTLMIDLALKEALSNRNKSNGSVYLFIDEFKLLPNLNHIDDAVNFGRSFGVKVFVAMQSITQLYDIYGEMKSKSILSGFLNYIFFNVNNAESRLFIKEYFGKHILDVIYGNSQHHFYEEYVVEDKNIRRLTKGCAIIGLQNVEPFEFKFEKWKDD